MQVVAGLKQHVAKEALLGSLVVAILNLKPAKLAGEASEAMLLAADSPLEGGGELVKILIPPGEASPISTAIHQWSLLTRILFTCNPYGLSTVCIGRSCLAF